MDSIDLIVKEIENSGDSESEDDDSIIRNNKKDKNEIPTELSIDNLLESRKKNPRFSSSNLSENAEESDKEDKENDKNDKKSKIDKKENKSLNLSDFDGLKDADGSIYASFENKISEILFDVLEIEIPHTLFKVFDLPNYLITALQHFPQLVPDNAEILFSYIHYIIQNNIFDDQMTLQKYSLRFNVKSLDYDTWKHYLLYSIEKSINAVFPIFSIFNFNLFNLEENTEEFNIVKTEICSFYFAMLCSSEIVNHRQFIHVLHTMRLFLLTIKLDNFHLDCIVNNMIKIALIQPVEIISSFISFFPIEGVGVSIIYQFSIKLIYQFFGLDNIPLTINKLSEELYRIKSLCESENEINLKQASAVLSLCERALISSFQLTEVGNSIISNIIHSFRFGLQNSDLGMLTQLKEQIHFTRNQLEIIMSSRDINDVPQS